MPKVETKRISTGVYLKSGSYWAVVRNVWHGPFDTPEQAQIKRDALKVDQAPKPEGGPFVDFMHKYYYPHFLEKMRDNTQVTGMSTYEHSIIPYFAQKKINEITLLDVYGYQQSMSEKGFAAVTINKRIALLKAIFEAAKTLGFTANNPAREIKSIHEKKNNRHVLTEREIIDLVNQIDHPFKYALAIIGLAGSRVGEVMAFQWDDFDLGDKPTISFKRTINILGMVDELKTQGSGAQLPILVNLRDLLLEWKAVSPDPKWLFQGNFRPHSILTKITKGDYFPPKSVSTWWITQRPEYGLSDMRLYDFRHSFATNVVTRCANIKTAQKLCRHSNINTTLDIYAHVRPEQLEEIWTWRV